MNAKECLANVESLIIELENAKEHKGHTNWDRIGGSFSGRKFFRIRAVCDECNIFDWWDDCLSANQLKQMRAFLKNAIKLGFTGYVCFKVGAKYCAHGMWAHKKESTTGYSPDGDCLFHSFRSGDNYFDMCINDVWMHEKYATKDEPCPGFTLTQIKKELELSNLYDASTDKKPKNIC